MTVSYVEYELQSGYIANWLVAGPQEIQPGPDLLKTDANYEQQIIKKYSTSKQEISTPPVERGPLNEGVFSISSYKGEWSYYCCKEDHLVDLSSSFQAGAYVRAWAYAQVLWEEDTEATFILRTEGPVDIWINKKLALHYTEFPKSQASVAFRAALKKGMNKVMIRLATVANPHGVLAIGLKIETEKTGKIVRIPTLIPSIERRNQLEKVYDQLYLERDIHAAGDMITLVFPESVGDPTYTDTRLQTGSGRIYGQAFDIGKPGSQVKLGTPASLPNTTYHVLVTPRDWELYESNIRITRQFNIWSLGRQHFSTTPYGTLESRQAEALTYASTVEDSLFAEIAKMALGKWEDLEPKVLRKSVENIHQRKAGSGVELLGLLGVLSRYGEQPELPEWLNQDLVDLALNFVYTVNEGAANCNKNSNEDYAIVPYTCAILAGQLFANEEFPGSGKSGELVRDDAEKLALAWMKKRGNYGFSAWDSKEITTQILSALSYLIDLAQNEEVWELASVLMDKIFFTIALNSYKGVYGSTQGYACTTDIKSGLLEPTSGITRLIWGMGIFNQNTAGTVSLACMKNYELPPIIAEIAAGSEVEYLNKEQQAGSAVPVNKITYKTPDYMLSSSQSYRPGEPGDREHAWQATLGPQSIVFVNHPGCSTENDAHTPNYWLGNGMLPRVAQHENVLIALYTIPDDAPLDFTHAYFPVKEFDDFLITGNTAFARKGEGYIALMAANGLEQVTVGKTAFRELRSPGKQNAWVCQMGRAAVDGDFLDFQATIRNQKISLQGLDIEMVTKEGDIRQFGWNSPLMYNNIQQSLSGFPHYQNPYTNTDLPCQQMDISTGNFLLRLKFDEFLSE